MAGIGLRRPYYAVYHYNDKTGAVTYSRGGVLGKAVEFSAKIESGSDNNLYADDGIAESDRSFAGGTLSITTDDLDQETSALILGVIQKEVLVGSETVTEYVFDESVAVPYLGFGIVIPRMKNGVASYRALVFDRIMFSVPEDAAKTKGEKIEWQTRAIEGTILRSEADGHPWKREVTVSTERLARDYIEQCLNITAEELGELSVASKAGTTTGDTSITVLPALETGNSYKYKVAANPTMPTLDQVCTSGWTNWDGTVEITAATGQKIVVAEVNGENLAKKAGIAIVTAKA